MDEAAATPKDDTPAQPSGVRQRFPELYSELKEIAAGMLSSRHNAGMSPTDLTHEAYAKLTAEEARRRMGNRSELGEKPDAIFRACFGAACRDVLVDERRRRAAQRRGGDRHQTTMPTDVPVDTGAHDVDFMCDLAESIEALEQQDTVLGKLAEVRFIGGLSVNECSAVLGISKRTIERRLRFVHAWLDMRLR
jgi:RNA polymerase sigma factor (TIGR02999 family)